MFLLRHGQSEFNAHFTRTKRDPGIVDPALTEVGRAQARSAGEALAGAGIERIIVSPYTRALQTAMEVAGILGVGLDVDPLVRERFAFACDIGSPRSDLAVAWPAHDFAVIDEVWWPDVFEAEESVVARAEAFRAAMRMRADAGRTLLVSHWGFLLALTGRSIGNGEWVEWHPHEDAPREIVWG